MPTWEHRINDCKKKTSDAEWCGGKPGRLCLKSPFFFCDFFKGKIR